MMIRDDASDEVCARELTENNENSFLRWDDTTMERMFQNQVALKALHILTIKLDVNLVLHWRKG